MRYLQGTQEVGISFKRNMKNQAEPLQLRAFADADYANDVDNRRSVSGYIVYTNGPIMWRSKLQQTVALSSTEAEYMALSETIKEILYFRSLMNELGYEQHGPTRIYEDNNGALKLAKNSVFHDRSKHIDIKHHFIREALENAHIDVRRVSSKKNHADIFTKSLGTTMHKQACSLLARCEAHDLKRFNDVRCGSS